MTPNPVSDGRKSRGALLWQVGVALAAVALYARTVGFGWVYDDQMEIVLNAYAHSLSNLRLIFGTTVWAGSGMETYVYRPMAVLSYALNHAVSGLSPWSYHLANVGLHAAVTVMVFRLGRLWGLGALSAGLGALLFAVHPVHVEVVANVVGRKDLLATGFVLAMALLHDREGKGWAVAATLAYLAAMLSKEVGAVGIFLVAAQDVHGEGSLKTALLRPGARFRYGAYGLALLLFLAMRSSVTGGVAVPETFYFDNPLVAVGAVPGLATALVVVGKGVALLAAPFTLSPDYSYNAIPVVGSVLDVRLLATVLALGALLWVLATGRGRGTVLPLAAAWYGLALLPTSNLLVRVGTIFGERLLYLPSVAFCLAAGAGLAWLTGRYRAEGRALAATLLVALALQSWRYTGAWTDDVSLFRWAVAAEPASTKAHHKLGEELLRAGAVGDALRSLDRALEIAPDNEFAAATLRDARAEVVRRYGAGDSPADADILFVLGQGARGRGDLAGAEALWTRAVAADAGHGPSLADLAVLSLARADTAEAVMRLEAAVLNRPSLVTAWFNLGRVHLAQGRVQEGREALARFVEQAGPRYPEQVAWARGVLAELGRR